MPPAQSDAVLQGPATARALARSATVAVICDQNRFIGQGHRRQIPQVRALSIVRLHGETKHLVEIAVVQVALPVNRYQRSAHYLFEIFVPVRAFEQIKVIVELAVRQQGAAEALDRQVGQGQQSIETDAVLVVQYPAVIGLQARLWRRQ